MKLRGAWRRDYSEFFDTQEALLIDAMDNADSIYTVFARLQSLAVKCGCAGKLLLHESVPYTDEMLAAVTKKTVPAFRQEITIEDSASVSVSETVTDSQITVTKNDSCVPDSHMKFIVQKVAELLDSQGIPCCHCSKTRYILSPLSACKDIFNTFTLNIICPYGNAAYRFELSVSPGDESAQKMPAVAEPSALKGGE